MWPRSEREAGRRCCCCAPICCGGAAVGDGGDVKVQYRVQIGWGREGRKEGRKEGRRKGEVFFCPFIFLATANTERKKERGRKLF